MNKLFNYYKLAFTNNSSCKKEEREIVTVFFFNYIKTVFKRLGGFLK